MSSEKHTMREGSCQEKKTSDCCCCAWCVTRVGVTVTKLVDSSTFNVRISRSKCVRELGFGGAWALENRTSL